MSEWRNVKPIQMLGSLPLIPRGNVEDAEVMVNRKYFV